MAHPVRAILVAMPTTSLADFIDAHPRLFVLTGAGCSTDSGIPDYRDADGGWKRAPPVTFQAFMGEEHTRRRYWARSLVGWRHFGQAQPNGTHRALQRLEATGRLGLLVTQNVDGLHQRAGSRQVIDLHGRLDELKLIVLDVGESGCRCGNGQRHRSGARKNGSLHGLVLERSGRRSDMRHALTRRRRHGRRAR